MTPHAVININRDRLEAVHPTRPLALAHAAILEAATGQLHGVQGVSR